MGLFQKPYSLDIWTKTDNVQTDGEVYTPTYSLAQAGVPGDLQPVSRMLKMTGALLFNQNYREIYLDGSAASLPSLSILAETTSKTFWILEGEPDQWRGRDGSIDHWQALARELLDPPDEIKGAY